MHRARATFIQKFTLSVHEFHTTVMIDFIWASILTEIIVLGATQWHRGSQCHLSARR